MADEEDGGLRFHSTPTLREFLRKVAVADNVPDTYRRVSSKLAQAGSVVSFSFLQDIYAVLDPSDRLPLYRVLAGSSIVVESPKPREKSEELKARLQKLKELAERKEYDDLVHDITKHTEDPEYFSSYKDQLGFGLHVALTMFTGFAFGYAVFRSQFRESPAMHAAGGATGLIIGMLLETVLFIVRDIQKEKADNLKDSSGKRE